MKNLSKRILSVFISTALVLSLGACAASGTSASAESSQTGGSDTAAQQDNSSTEVPVVTLWGSGGQEVREALQAIVDAMNADPDYNTKVKAEVQFVVSGTSEQSLADRLAAAYTAGETDTDFDLIAIDDNAISTIVAQTGDDFFLPIDTSKLSNYANLIFTENVVGDTFIPYRGTTVMLAYNSDTVTNPPETADELYQWIKDNPGRFAYCDPSTGGSGYTFVATTIYNQLPTEAATSSDTKWETDYAEEWDKAFDLLTELHPYLYSTAGAVQYPMKNAGTLDLLANQQIDMTPAFVNMVLSQKSMGTLPESIKLTQIDPAFSGALAGFSIPTIAGDQEAALTVIDYFLSYTAQSLDWNTMYATPVVETSKLTDLDNADWLSEASVDSLRYFSIGSMQTDINTRWAEQISPLAQ